MSKNPNISGGLAQNYIDDLEQALKDAENILKVNNAYYNSAAFAFNEAKAWEDKLKRYWDNIRRTDELAQAIIDEMNKLDQQTVCVCDNATGYRDAVKILLCCVKDIATMLEGMSDELTDLMTRIDCVRSKDPVLDTSKSILKCLMDFKGKLDAALKSSLDALKACLALLRAAGIMLDEKKALRSYIDWLQETGQVRDRNDFTEVPSELDENCQTPQSGDSPCPEIGNPLPCTPPLKAPMSLEINCSAYYTSSRDDYGAAESIRINFKKKLDLAQKVRDGAASKRDAAIKALNDAKTAKQCK